MSLGIQRKRNNKSQKLAEVTKTKKVDEENEGVLMKKDI